jgi:hypothetical protein
MIQSSPIDAADSGPSHWRRFMIDTQSEQVITFGQAADCLPRRRRGRKTHVSTIYRWASSGHKGVILESLQIGGTRCTSKQALQRFFERLSESRQIGAGPGGSSRPGPMLRGRTLAQRQRAAAEAGRKLAEMGA